MQKPPSELLPLETDDGPTDAQLTVMPRTGELVQFQPFLEILAANEAKALAMRISRDMPPDERKALAKTANELRLSLKKARCSADKAKDSLLEDVKEFSKKVHAANGDIWDRCEKAEKHLEGIEKFEETERRRVEQENRTKRANEIAPFLSGPCVVDLGMVTEDEYQQMLADSRQLHGIREEEKRKAKADADAKAAQEAEDRKRIAAEQEAERQRIADENARLKKEAAAREAAAKAERERIEKEREKERAEAAAKQRAIEEKARVDRENAEQMARVERVKLQQKLDDERATAKRLADAESARFKKEAEEKKKADAAAKKAAAAPDLVKLRKLADDILNESLPAMASDRARNMLNNARDNYHEEVLAIIAQLES